MSSEDYQQTWKIEKAETSADQIAIVDGAAFH
jgi:hypothetical protein